MGFDPRVRTDHQADDLIGTLLVEAIRPVERKPLPLLQIAFADPIMAARGIDQNARGEVAADVQKRKRDEGLDRVLLPSEHRQVEFADGCVPKLVRQDEKHIADDKMVTSSRCRGSRPRTDGLASARACATAPSLGPSKPWAAAIPELALSARHRAIEARTMRRSVMGSCPSRISPEPSSRDVDP